MTVTTVPFSSLKRDPANVRKAGREADTLMIESVREHGILIPLIVRKNGSGYYVTEGGRRLSALEKLKVADDYAVPVVIREDNDQTAKEISLTANVVRQAMHPVDEFEAIAELYRGGKGLSLADIGKRFNMSQKQIRQYLALGSLHPDIREAFRRDEIDEQTAQAYTLETDPERQLAIFKGRYGKTEWQVRQHILGDSRNGPRFLKFVGKDVYLAAGGKVAEDLFSEGEETKPLDMKLLTKMAEEKLEKKIEGLKAKGWKWVMTAQEAGHGAYMWTQDRKAAKNKSGVIVEITNAGTLSLKEHILKPAEERARQKKKDEKNSGEPRLSNALVRRMSEAVTSAASYAIAKEPHVALAAVVASLLSSHSCIGISNGQWNDGDFCATFKSSLKKTDKQLLDDLAELVGQAVNMGAEVEEHLPFHKEADGEFALILNSLDAREVTAQIQIELDLEDYFNSAPKDMLLAAIRESINADEARKISGKPKSEIAKFCIANIGTEQWLPPELRVKGYKVTKVRR